MSMTSPRMEGAIPTAPSVLVVLIVDVEVACWGKGEVHGRRGGGEGRSGWRGRNGEGGFSVGVISLFLGIGRP